MLQTLKSKECPLKVGITCEAILVEGDLFAVAEVSNLGPTPHLVLKVVHSTEM